MQTIVHITSFIIGTLFGSFFTLAIHRIPLKQNITHERSYCPKCNHRLEFIDLIPVLSYIAIGGKCRYCKEKINIRYFLIEILAGIIFLTTSVSISISIPTSVIITIAMAITYCVVMLILVDKPNKSIFIIGAILIIADISINLLLKFIINM